MSAIYGAICLEEKHDFSDLAQKWKSVYDTYCIDRQEQILSDCAFMGCAVQYFTEIAKKEQLPIWNRERNILFTADCVLDNREELSKALGVDEELPDGQLLYRAFLKWGKDCCEKLRGVFSFVAYDLQKREVFLATDQFSQRCLFYHIRDGILYFSTLLRPLLKDSGLTFEKNERWLVDTVSIRAAVMITEPRETALKEVYKVVSGKYVIVDSKGMVSEHCYYNPRTAYRVDSSITLKQSEVLVRERMSAIVKGIIREGNHIGAQLSCGLDSSTVACVAAGQLAGMGKELRSYTSIPDSEAKLQNKGGILYDESEGVKIICKAYPNIVPTFVDAKGRVYLEEAGEQVAIWEMPCKSQQNAVWIDEIYRRAKRDGCRIMLGGSTGNCTISAGSIQDTAWEELKKCHLRKAYHMFDGVSLVGVSRKKYVKALLNEVKTYFRWYVDSRERDCYLYTVTRKELGEAHRLTERFHKEMFHFKPFKSFARMHEEMYMLNANAQIGEIDTKHSLQYGILLRDPMRTVDFLELSFRLPMECFASVDYDRRLVRVGMEGIVPEKIRKDVLHRGRQSGDNIYRIGTVWEKLLPQIKELLYKEQMLHYLDKEKLDRLFDGLTKEKLEERKIDVLLVVDLYSFGRYLEYLESKETEI